MNVLVVISKGSDHRILVRLHTKELKEEVKSLIVSKKHKQAIVAALTKGKFEREVEIMEQEGYRIPDSQREALVGQLQASRNPVALLESWRDLFARDPIGTKIDMSRAALPRGMDIGDVGSLVKQFAGKPEEFARAINSRMKG